MMDSFRCVHASRLLLDHQLHGTRLSGAGSLAPEVRKTVEDATLIAFERIIDACLVHDADCLLISGESFHPDDHSLRGPAALVRGIQRLAERDIPVILESGILESGIVASGSLRSDRADPWSRWPAGLRFPPNAHRLGEGFETSVPVARQGKLLATISTSEQPRSAARNWQILIPEASGTFRTVSLPGDSGPAQGIRNDETGPRGCALIVFDAGGEARETFIPTAPVRWERFAVTVAAEMTRDDLLQEMASLLEKTPRKPCEKVWLIGWELSGEGRLLEGLSERHCRDELTADLIGLDPVPNVHLHAHSVRVHLPTGASSKTAHRATAGQDDLAAEYAARLDERFARPEAALQECLEGSGLASGPWKVKFETVFNELDVAEVAHHAQRVAPQWFASLEEQPS